MGFESEERRKYKKEKDYRDPDKDRDKDRHRDRNRDRDRDRGGDKDRGRDYERSRDRGKDRDRKDHKRRDSSSRDRDRDRKKHRSPERDRDRHDRRDAYRRSRSRSRKDDRGGGRRWERDQRRDFRFDSPPRDQSSEASEDPEKMQKLNRLKAQQELVSSKTDRKLHVGNIPPNINATQLMELLNNALKKMDINTDNPGDSIVSAWISPDGVGHFAFIEFRTAQEATNGTALNNASLFGYQLKLGRPRQYLEYIKQLMNDVDAEGDIDNILKKIKVLGTQNGIILPEIEERVICPPSKVLILKHIVTLEELSIDEEYQEIEADVKEMAERFGKVVKLIIPRPIQHIDLESAPLRVKGLGYVYIEYENAEVAKRARKQFVTKMFSERSVACGFFDPDRFRQGELDISERIVITF